MSVVVVQVCSVGLISMLGDYFYNFSYRSFWIVALCLSFLELLTWLRPASSQREKVKNGIIQVI